MCAVEIFSLLFALSLIPAIIVWVLMLLAIPLNFSHLEPVSLFKVKEKLYYLHYFGSIFQNDTINTLPYGGKLARLSGIYDEPGTVGTFAALFLAMSCFKRGWKNTLIFLAGILSFSAAFYILSVISSALLKKYRISFLLIITFSLCYITPHTPFNTRKVQPSIAHILQDPLVEKKYGKAKQAYQFIRTFDNRSSLSMDSLFSTYLNGEIKTLLFGIASDANAAFEGGASSSWKIILTNYGLVGFLYLTSFLLGYVFFKTKNLANKFEIYTFLFVFILNIYQRPFIWIPSYMLLFLGAVAYLTYKEEEETPLLA
ncbi:MAG: hypothetical protein P4L79_05090 [Legionella sp.]|uniref:hypothetical protein n=1 Tax=Legionella sp. TaxID=459 RepID=UPI00285115FB|nr:hypothetical protein [Legionella sp.]